MIKLGPYQITLRNRPFFRRFYAWLYGGKPIITIYAEYQSEKIPLISIFFYELDKKNIGTWTFRFPKPMRIDIKNNTFWLHFDIFMGIEYPDDDSVGLYIDTEEE